MFTPATPSTASRARASATAASMPARRGSAAVTHPGHGVDVQLEPGQSLQHGGRVLVGVDGDRRDHRDGQPRRARRGHERRDLRSDGRTWLSTATAAPQLLLGDQPVRAQRPAAAPSASRARRRSGRSRPPASPAAGRRGRTPGSPRAARRTRGRRRSRTARPRRRRACSPRSSCSSTTRLRSRQARVIHGRQPWLAQQLGEQGRGEVGPVLVLADEHRVGRLGQQRARAGHRRAVERRSAEVGEHQRRRRPSGCPAVAPAGRTGSGNTHGCGGHLAAAVRAHAAARAVDHALRAGRDGRGRDGHVRPAGSSPV